MSSAITAVPGRHDDSPGDRAGLTFARGVPRHLVHRRALSEVMLTDWRRDDGDGRYEIAAQWSRSHRLYRVVGGRHDPLVLVETLRQSGILLSHEALGVPLDHRLVMERISWATGPHGIPAGRFPCDVVGRVRIAEPRRRSRDVVTMRIDIGFHDHRDVELGTATGWARCLSPALFDRLRGTATPGVGQAAEVPSSVVARTAVGVSDDEDVVLAPATGTRSGPDWEWRLRVPTDHAVLFDHPLDHVPGMLVLEGMRQAGRLLSGRPDAHLAACDATFGRFVELDSPSHIGAEIIGRHGDVVTLRTTVRQAGGVAVSGDVTMRTADAGPADGDRTGAPGAAP